MESSRGTSPSKNAVSPGPPEHQLLEAFKAAALNVTKLYKTSVSGLSKARADGYQDCLDEILSFLDKSNIGVSDGEGWTIRKWATERLVPREAQLGMESEDEVEKPESVSSPEIHNANSEVHTAAPTSATRTASQLQPEPTSTTDDHMFIVPTQDNFTFRSAHPYPPPHSQESYPNLETLNLSNAGQTSDSAAQGSSIVPIAHPTRSRSSNNNRRGQRNKPTSNLGKGAGQKRPMNYADFFGLPDIPKEAFGREGKRRC
ncbi:hypothetical protein F4819DRAFT_276971 [Hypoxylon fuscum]|nr:hypothetical protein F4819DRAFT_276971 [Hypoxylon fuscum]